MTKYIATIPGQHISTHRSERTAIRAIRAAEKRLDRRDGQVIMSIHDGTYRSVTTVYGFPGRLPITYTI